MTREEAIHFANCLKENYTIDFNDMEAFCNIAIKALEQEPCEDCISRAIIPQPKKGEWIKQNDDYFDWYECSECGYGSEGEMKYSREYDVRTNYCPNCGSKMLEGEEVWSDK